MEIKIQNKSNSILYRALFCPVIVVLIVFFYNLKNLSAQSHLNGVIQNYLAAQTTGGNKFIAARNRLRFQFEKPTDFGGFTVEMDLIHSFKEAQELDFLLKEAYFDWYLDKYDLRIGHQKIIWGRTNGAFITDIITPVDLREFLTISAEDIRFGITSFNAIRYFGSNSFQLVIAPFFQPDLLPSADSRWFPGQQISSAFSPISVNSVREDQSYTIEDVQLALRYSYLSPDNIDLDLFLMRWTHPTPAYNISFDLVDLSDIPSINLIESYQNSWMAGLSGSLKIHQKIFFLVESFFVGEKLFTQFPFSEEIQPDSFSDASSFFDLVQNLEPEKDGFVTTKPWIHSMAGVRTELFKTMIEAQFFVEAIFEYEDQILQEKFYKYTSLLATRSFLRDRLQVLSLSRYNTDTKDFWVQLQGQYELDDNLQLTLGTNLFGGEKADVLSGHLSFSRFRENSFIFSKIALFF